MAGLSDIFGLFGGGGQAPTPGLLDAAGYMDPAQYDAARRAQSMSGLWAGLLQGGGPSLQPRNFGSALGAGLIGQQQFGNQFDESQLQASQAAQARANVGKLGAEAENLRSSTKLLADAAREGSFAGGGGPGGAGGTGTGTTTPNFGEGTGGGRKGGSGGWGPHAATAIETLREAGLSDAAIQGIMANGLGEGGFQTNWQKSGVPTAGGGTENSFGHWQFYDKGELPGYQAWVKQQGGDPRDTRMQALYVAKRAEEVSPGFSKLTDPKQATDLFATKFERYKGAAPGQRYGLLADAQRYISGIPVEERQAIPVGPGGYTGAPEEAPRRGPVPMGITQVRSYAGALGGPEAPAPAVLAAPAGAPPPAPPGPLMPRTAAPMPLPPGGGSGSTIRPIAAIDDAGYGGGGDDMPAGPQFASGVLRGPAPPPPGPAPIPQAIAPAPPVPPAPPAAAPPAPVPPAPAAAAPVPSVVAPPAPATAAIPPRPELPARPPLPAQPALPAAPAPPPMPGAVAVPALPAVQAPPPSAVPYDPRAHKAQMIATALAMAGRSVPGFISEAAGLPLAGQKAALEAAARQPYSLQGQAYGHALAMAKADWEARNKTQQDQYAAQLGMTGKEFDASIRAQETDYNTGVEFAKKEWDAANDDRKAQIAFNNGLSTKEYEKRLEIGGAEAISEAQARGALPSKIKEQAAKTDEEIRKELDTPRAITIIGPDGKKYRTMKTPREERAEEQARASAAPGGAPGGPPPIPGVLTEDDARTSAIRTDLGKQQVKEVGEIREQGKAARRAAVDTDALLNAGDIDWQGAGAGYKQVFNRLTQQVLGWNSDYVQTYENAQYLMGQQIRQALRASDPNPTGKQQEMLMETFPTPATSKAGYQSELRYMQGIQDWQMDRERRVNEHMNLNNNDPQGFKDTTSAIPFVYLRMSPADQDAYMARVYRADPEAARQLNEQASIIRDSRRRR